MEETSIVHVVTIFVSSNQLEKLNIVLFDLQDQPFETVSLKNYTTHSLRLPEHLTSFYCVATSPDHPLEEQFQCDFSENEKPNDKLVILKSFSLFKIKMEAEIITEYRLISDENNPQKEQAVLYSIAGSHLKKLEQKIIKKLELDELARPIPSILKKSHRKSKELKKSKTNFTIKNPLKESSFFQKMEERTEKKSSSIKYFNESILTESEHVEEHRNLPLETLGHRGRKHMTHIPTACRHSENRSSKKDLDQPSKDPEIPEYERLFRAINQSASKIRPSKRRARNTHNSLVQQLQRQTKKQLQMQKDLIGMVRNAASQLNISIKSGFASRATPSGTHSSNSSPLKALRSKAFRKKKMR